MADVMLFDTGTYHVVKDCEEGRSAEGWYAIAYCGRWASESWVTRDARVDLLFPICTPCHKAHMRVRDRAAIEESDRG